MKTSFKLGFVLLVLGGISLFPSQVLAIEYGGIGGKPANPDPANSRTNSIFVFTLSPGESKEDGVIVVNNTAEEKELLIYATDSQKSSDGSFACEQYADTRDEVGQWIDIDQSEVILQPSTNAKVNFKIKIPDNASVGEQNGCIMIQEKSNSNSVAGGVALSFRTGLRVVVTVPGQQIRQIDFADFQTSIKKDGVILAKVSIANSGNVSVDTNIELVVNSILGINYMTINNEYPILREQTAEYNFEIPKPFWGGIFMVTASAEYDQSQDAKVGIDSAIDLKVVSGNSTVVFSMPDPLGLVIEVGVVGTLVTGIVIYYRRRRDVRKMQKTWHKHELLHGEDINTLAGKYKVPWRTLARVNKLKPPYTLKAGNTILVPSIQRN